MGHSNAANKNYGLQTLTERGHQRQDRKEVLLVETLLLLRNLVFNKRCKLVFVSKFSSGVLSVSVAQLDPPLDLHDLVDAQQAEAHHGDDDAGQKGKHTFPQSFGIRPVVLTDQVEQQHKHEPDTQADREASDGAYPHVQPEFTCNQLMFGVFLGVFRLLSVLLVDEREQHRDDDGRLQRLPEDDEENLDRKIILQRRHDDERILV